MPANNQLKMGILEELEWRGLLADCTDREELGRRLAQGPIVLYAGFDPTADSLHVGNLMPLLTLRRFQGFGHRPIAVAGGATGMIGDPSGRSSERPLIAAEAVARNIVLQTRQLERLLDFGPENPSRALLFDNAVWTAPVGYLDFLRDIGKHFAVNVMIGKESVRARMEDREGGVSYTESWQATCCLLQAFDFYHLFRSHDCETQTGGSDQWAVTHAVAYVDLIRKKRAAGLTA